jgi:hypothetical protein
MSDHPLPPEDTGRPNLATTPLDLTELRRIVLKWRDKQPPIYHDMGVVIGLFKDHTKITPVERRLFITLFSLPRCRRSCKRKKSNPDLSWLRVMQMLARKQVDIGTFTAHEFVHMYPREVCAGSTELRQCDITLLADVLNNAGFDW